MVKHESSFKTCCLPSYRFFSGKTQGLFWIYYVTQSFSREIPEILNFEFWIVKKQHKTHKFVELSTQRQLTIEFKKRVNKPTDEIQFLKIQNPKKIGKILSNAKIKEFFHLWFTWYSCLVTTLLKKCLIFTAYFRRHSLKFQVLDSASPWRLLICQSKFPHI